MTGAMPRRLLAKATVLGLALFTSVFLAPFALGQSGLRPLPPILSTISDEVGVLTVEQGQTLATTLADIEERTRVTIVVVILKTTRPESIEAYVQRLIDRWRRESKRLDHGRFVFVAVAKEDRELRIVPSRKLAWVLKEIGKSEFATEVQMLLKQDKYFEAMTAIANALARLIADRPRPTRDRVVSYTPHVRVDIVLKDEDMDAALAALRKNQSGVAGRGVYRVADAVQQGQL